MDVTQPLLRAAQGGARTRLLVDDRVVVVDAHNGTEPVARATPAFGEGRDNLGPRREHAHTLPLNPPATLFGRERELEELTAALDAGDTAVLSACAGLGKTVLLHQLGVTRADRHRDGAVLLSGRGRTVEDLLFEVFRAFYEVPGRRPGPDDLRRHLTAIKALILVDDVADPARLARALAEYAPYSRVALATEAERVGRDAFSELVAGIEARDALVAGVAFGDALAVDDEDLELEDLEGVEDLEGGEDEDEESGDALTAEVEDDESDEDGSEHDGDDEDEDEPVAEVEVADDVESEDEVEVEDELTSDVDADESDDDDDDADDEDDSEESEEETSAAGESTSNTKSAKPAQGSGDDDQA